MEKLVSYAGFIMGPLMVGLGAMLFFQPPPTIEANMAKILSGGMVAYGGFRFWRSYVLYKRNKEKENQNKGNVDPNMN